jgi:hypothetical protein
MPNRIALAALIAFLAPSSLASSAGNDGGKERPFEVQMNPGGIHEECVRLEAGRSRAFRWKSDGPVDFNIHFHRGDDVSYPVKLNGQVQGAGRFTAKSGEDYCWMWTAKRPTRVTGTLGAEE